MEVSFSNISGNQSPPEHLLTNGQRLARVILLPLLIVIGVVGNLLVCIAVFKTPKLRKVVNYFIVSLAVSDLLVCTIVLPLAIHQEYNHQRWGLEKWVCRLWVTLDVLLCTASIWNLCLVSTDRYLAVVKPNQYAKWRTPRNAAISIGVVWILATVVALMISFTSDADLETCIVTSKPAVTVLGPLIAFYIPCLILLFLYWKIYIAVRDYTLRRRPSRMTSTEESSSTDASTKQQINITPNQSFSKISNNSEDSNNLNKSWRQTSIEKSGRPFKRRSMWPLQRSISTRSTASVFRREKKSAIVLAIVVASFIGCWLPFFIVYLLQLCKCAANLALPEAFNATTWLGWCNSLINPMIYTLFNKDFRRAFKRILFCGKCKEIHQDSSDTK